MAEATVVRQEIRQIVCKECGSVLDPATQRLCGFECTQDNKHVNERPPEKLEIRIYVLDRVESYSGEEVFRGSP